MSKAVLKYMLRTKVLVDDATQSNLDANVLDDLISCLWPQDCQTCGWSLGVEPCALVIEDTFVIAHASLHHTKCKSPRWNDSGLHEYSGAPLISWVVNSVAFPAGDGENPKDFIAGMVLNPSLEMVSLRRASSGKWELAAVHLFREMGFVSPREGIYLGRSVPHSGVIMTPTSWRVYLAGGLETYEVNPEPEMNKLALRRKGIFAIITQAADPGQLTLDVMNKIMASVIPLQVGSPYIRSKTRSAADQTMPQAVGDVRRERRRDAEAEQPPRQPRHGQARRTESSTTVELAQIGPSTVNGMRWAVHSVSPCVY
jgi:hypothetical protein